VDGRIIYVETKPTSILSSILIVLKGVNKYA